MKKGSTTTTGSSSSSAATAEPSPLPVDKGQRKKRYESLVTFAKKIIPLVQSNEGSLETPNGLEERLYFRGFRLLEFLESCPEKKHKFGEIRGTATNAELCQEMLSLHIFTKAIRVYETAAAGTVPRGKRDDNNLRIFRLPVNDELSSLKFETGTNDRYVWLVDEGDSAFKGIMLTIIMLMIIGMTLQSVWPPIVRNIIWYICATLLVAVIVATIVQLVVFSFCWIFGWSIWILPNLWGDGNPLLPLYSIDRSETKAVYSRILLVSLFAGGGYMAYTSPEQLQIIWDTQKLMVEDLYSGNILKDANGLALPGMGSGTPWGGKWGPGSNRYGAKPANIPKFEDIEHLGEEENSDGNTDETNAKKAEAEAAADAQRAQAAQSDFSNTEDLEDL